MRRAMDSQVLKEKILAFEKVHAALKDVVKHDKCRLCSCFYADVLEKVYQTLKSFNDSVPEHRLDEIQADFENWARDLDQLKLHG